MKKVLTIFLTIIAVQTGFAQRFNWATSGGYAGITNSFLGAVDIARDPQGNIYTMDYANGAQQCQGDTISPLSNYTTFIYKFDAQGNLLFINRVGALSGDFYCFNLETDDDGNLYLLGQPNGVTFIIVNEDTVPAVGNTNQLIKIDSSGNFVWKQNTGFASNGEGCMLQYSNGYLYYQSGNLSLSKIATDGTIVATLTASYYSSPTASMGIIFKGSGVFSNSDLLFAAYSRGEVAYGTDTLFNTGNPFLTAPVLLMRCDTNLTVGWARYLSNARDPDQNFIPVAIDDNDDVYAAVQVNEEMIIGNDTINNPNGNFIGEGAIVKVSSSGADVWARALVSSNTAIAWCMQRATDNTGIFIGGGYTGNATFGPFTLTNGSNSRPFIAKINSGGNFTNAFSYLQAPSGTDAKCLSADNNGNYLVGGKLPNSTIPVFSCTPIAGNNGFYLGSFREQPDSVPTPSIVQNGNLLTATPPFTGDIQWLLNGTPIAGANGQTYTATQNGSYSVIYEYNTGCVGSDTSDVEIITVSSIRENGEWNASVYPNPFSNEIGIETNDDLISEYSVFTANGKLVVSSSGVNASRVVMDTENWNAGVYFIQLTTARSSVVVRAVKAH